MQVPISPAPLIGDMDSVSYYVYFLDLCIPHRIIHNMVLLDLGGKPIFPSMTSLGVGVYGVVLAMLGL